MKLNTYIAHAGVCSRRNAALLIKAGKVRLNGMTVTAPWTEVNDKDKILVNKRPISTSKHIYIVFNKPKGVTTTLEDKYALKKVIDFIPPDIGRVYPVGRLDKDSRGLLILTNDGDLCNRLTHPSFGIEKEYEVLVRGRIDEQTVKGLKRGITDGAEHLSVKSAVVTSTGSNGTLIRTVVCEGKKRHIRRLFERFGMDVKDLKRVRVAGLKLGDIHNGHFRVLDKRTIYRLLFPAA